MELLDATLLSWFVIALSPLTLLTLLKYDAPYGRYVHQATQLIAELRLPLPDVLVPAKIAWFVQEIPSFAVPLALIAASPADAALWRSVPNKLLLGAFLIHYFNRSVIYPARINGRPVPLLIMVLAALFCIVNGYIQGTALVTMHRYADGWMASAPFLLGMLLWTFGFLANLHADHVLRNLRAPGETCYRIPRGGLFEYVSCANYGAEIIEWSGFAIACSNLQAASFALFTLANLVPRALRHHSFYLKTIDNYPKNRKAVLPYVI